MKRLFPILLVVMALTAAVLACSAGGPPTVTKVEMCEDVVDNSECVNPTTTISSSQDPLHALVSISNFTAENQLQAKWYAVDAVDAAGTPYTDEEITVTDHTPGEGSGTIDFTLEYGDIWPTGSYKVEIYLDGTLTQTAEFEIVP
ncbi:MAG TPA: hypothetical protein PK299_04750 [Anaerolineales bacterium]|nr:hypothetical protein [Anaerolineales bacterium]